MIVMWVKAPHNTAEQHGQQVGAGGKRDQGQADCLHRACAICALGSVQSFHFPLFMTMLHLAVIFLFSALSRALVQCSSHRARVVLSWTDYLRRVAPTGVCLCPVLCRGGGEGPSKRRLAWEQKDSFLDGLKLKPFFPRPHHAS